jgi:tetratricopeptide (TPR) repeat protein
MDLQILILMAFAGERDLIGNSRFVRVATGWMRRLRQATGDGGGPAQRAVQAVNEAKRAHDAGDLATAARLGDAALTDLRALVGSGVRVAEPALARGLLNQSQVLSGLSRHAEAVAAAEEAVSLARAEPKRPQTLAVALTALAHQLMLAGRPADGLDAAREARAIGSVPPDAVLAQLLMTLGTALAHAGEHDEALAQSERAVGMWRALAGNDREGRFQLARALTGHANRLSSAGRWADAIEFSAESVGLHRELAEEMPGKLAPVLTDHAIMLSRVGREEEALAAAAEAAGRETTEAPS